MWLFCVAVFCLTLVSVTPFVSESLFGQLYVESFSLSKVLGLSVLLPIGDRLVVSQVSLCKIEISQRRLQSELLVLSLTEFDIILGMDWLTRYSACIDCSRK